MARCDEIKIEWSSLLGIGNFMECDDGLRDNCSYLFKI
jgi:hypothetical protein